MKRTAPIVLLVAGALMFACGLGWMLQVRLERGDSYPPYSSLRSDPLGTMALYESLGRLPVFTVSRDFRNANQMPGEAGTVYLHLGAHWLDWESLPQDLFGEIEAFLGRGGRLVVVMNPVTHGGSFDSAIKRKQDAENTKNAAKNPPPDAKKPDGTGADAKGSSKPAPAPKKTNQPDKADDEEVKTVSLKDRWGLEFDFDDLPYSETDLKVEVNNVSGLDLPARLDWHSGLHFGELDPAWHAIYSRDKFPVVIERHFGTGTVVMATDGYFLSNEALRKERHPDLLAWLMGSARRVVFDEAHFGIVDVPGVAGLIRHYHLEGLVAAFILLALLFIWKNLSSLVPAYNSGSRQDFIEGRASSAGFVNLLRRNVPDGELLDTCFAEWKKSSAAARPGLKLAEVQAVLDEEQARPARQRDAVCTYARIVEILKRPAFAPVPPPLSAKPAPLP